MSAENKALVRRSFDEIWGKKNIGIVDEIYADDYVSHDIPPGMPPNREGFKMFVGMYTSAFPNTRMTIEDIIAEGDKVVARWSAVGKHEGELMGIPATGKEVHITGMGISRIANGKIVESWGEFDTMGMMTPGGLEDSN